MKSSLDTQVFTTIEAYRGWRKSLKDDQSGKSLVGLVPTMGALHNGHLSLIEQARKQCQKTVVSIFVNPLQFGPNEDFDRYPRTFPKDLVACREAGVDAILHPEVSEFYPHPVAEITKVIPPEGLINHLCGPFRPGHFEGVATVVMKLFQVAQPSRAYFGEKDYQQLTVIKRMVSDLNLHIEVVPVSTMRQHDGLAMSSRNVYLTDAERDLAPQLHEVLSLVADKSLSGELSLSDAMALGKEQLKKINGLTLQYLEACDAVTLAPLKQARMPMVVLIAAKLGAVRLIDNVIRI